MIKIESLFDRCCYFSEKKDKLKLFLSLQPSLDFILCVSINGPQGSGKRLTLQKATKDLEYEFFELKVIDFLQDTLYSTARKLKSIFQELCPPRPCAIYLSDIDLLTNLNDTELCHINDTLSECILSKNSKRFTFFAGSSSYSNLYSSSISSLFHHSINFESATSIETNQILATIERQTNCGNLSLELISKCYKGNLFLGNLLNYASRKQLILCENKFKDNIEIGKKIVNEMQDMFCTKLNYEDDDTSWRDIGGLKNVIQQIIDTIELSLKYPQLAKSGLRRSGILLYGPPGTGKTLLARAVSNQCNMHFINVKGPELINIYVGQSEENVRKLFSDARKNKPTVIFFDELDSLAPARGRTGDSGGVMDRVVSQILAELDSSEKNESVYVIGATNRVDLLEPSLLRPGRFDLVLEVPLPKTKTARIEVLEALTKKMKLDDDVSVEWIESEVSGIDLSGADFQGICSLALQNSIERNVKLIECGELDEGRVCLSTSKEDFICAINDILSRELLL